MTIQRVASWAVGLVMLSMTVGATDGPPPAVANPPVVEALPSPESIKPAPLTPIPDNPPPAEGAMFDLPYVIEPPDLVVIDVLEALPGRRIEGERLVRPDGTVSLGFYGDVHVRGLTCKQAKTKVVLHLRKFLNDEALGLVEPLDFKPEEEDDEKPEQATASENHPSATNPAKATRSVAPADTWRVFLDVGVYNSKFYFVQGAVAAPGRFPVTGNETVLDALNFAGGFVPGYDPKAIKLIRPARGVKPAKVYEIDYAAIIRNEAGLNYQLFPGDRLEVGDKRGQK